jgi:hypothetical protein
MIEGFNSFFLWANFYLNYNSLYSTQNVLPQTEGEGERDGGEREEREREREGEREIERGRRERRRLSFKVMPL